MRPIRVSAGPGNSVVLTKDRLYREYERASERITRGNLRRILRSKTENVRNYSYRTVDVGLFRRNYFWTGKLLRIGCYTFRGRSLGTIKKWAGVK